MAVTYLNPKSAPKPGMYSHVAIAEGGRIAPRAVPQQGV